LTLPDFFKQAHRISESEEAPKFGIIRNQFLIGGFREDKEMNSYAFSESNIISESDVNDLLD
jgi:hypothetical protein